MMIWIKLLCFQVNYVINVVTRELGFEYLKLVYNGSVLICENDAFIKPNMNV